MPGAVAQRHRTRLPFGPGLDVGADALKFRPISRLSLSVISHLREVVGHPVLEPGIVDRDLLPVAGQVEVEEVSAFEEVARAGDEQIAFELRPEPASL